MTIKSESLLEKGKYISLKPNIGAESVEKVLSNEIEDLYPNIEKLPYLVHSDKGWFNEYVGQIQDK
jgi:hypothetical protein